jgi:hypothetical protein
MAARSSLVWRVATKKDGSEDREKSVRAYYERDDGGFARSSTAVPIAWAAPMLQAATFRESGLATSSCSRRTGQ